MTHIDGMQGKRCSGTSEPRPKEAWQLPFPFSGKAIPTMNPNLEKTLEWASPHGGAQRSQMQEWEMVNCWFKSLSFGASWYTAMRAKVTSVVSDCVILWTVTHQAPLPIGFSRQEYWSGLLCHPPGDLLDPGLEPTSLMSSALVGRFFTTRATWEAPSWYTAIDNWNKIWTCRQSLKWQLTSLLWCYKSFKKSVDDLLSFTGGSGVKNPPAMQEMLVWSLIREDLVEEGMATHPKILTWIIPQTEEPGRLQSTGSQKVR